MKTSGLTGAVLGVAAVFGLSWIAAIAYWRLGTRVPGPGEIAGVMLGMPTGLSGLLMWWQRREPSGPKPDAAKTSPGATGTAVPQPRAGLALESVAVELPGGNDPASLLAGAGAGLGLTLHPQLRDPQGFGVLAAEVAELDTAPVAAELARLADATAPIRAEVARALGLSESILEKLLADRRGAAPTAARLVLPATWSEAERGLAKRWVDQRLDAVGPAAAPPSTVAVMASGRELFDAMRDSRQEGPVLWLALSSNIGAGTIDRWARRGMLFGAAQPKGRAPGEAAVGVIVNAHAEASDNAVLYFPDKPPTSPTGPDDTALAARIDDVLAAGAVMPGDIRLLVSDADHDPGRCAQLARLASARFHEVDPGQGVLRLGQTCGHADAALSLAALALCAHAAHADGHASLAVAFDEVDAPPAVALLLPPSPAH